jgi:Carboxypeptidase regulatory-like domain/TonB dependent receptor
MAVVGFGRAVPSLPGGAKVRTSRTLLSAGLIWLFAAGISWAQAVAGSQVSGVVKDSSGGVLPGVEVTITKTDTGTVRTVFTGADGSYVLPNLPVGPYKLKVVLQGFNTYVQEGIVLQVNTNPTIDVALTVGSVGEQVTVTASAATVETRSTGVGQVIDNQQVTEIPLNGRQATELIFLSGLATSAPAGDLNTNKNFPTVTISVAGGQANGITYIMDGGTHNDPFNNLNLPTPFPDALQEFKVETSSLPARYGHHAASAVNLVTKSGTNAFHGNAFDFVRNYHFNARNFFAPTRDSLRRNQFGGTLGGPILKDKLFFFDGYQGRVEKSKPPETTSFVPTAAMLAGDFTGITAPSCSGRQVPLSSAAGFTNNRIDPALFNPVALNILEHVPVSTDPCGRLQYGIPNNSTEHQNLSRADYTISRSQSVFGRYLYAVYDNPATYDGSNALTLSRTGQNNQVHSLVVGHNWILSPRMVNAVHVTWNKTLNDRPMPSYFSPTDVGSTVVGAVPGFMGVSVTNGFNFGTGGTNPGYFNSNGFQLANDLDFLLGKHQVSFGGNWIHTNIETVNNRPSNGQFTFNGQSTGLGLADFMLGRMSSFLQGNPVLDYDHNNYVGAYVQDEWKLKANLTINAGVRWEPYLPIKNTLDYVSNFDLARFDAGTRSTVYPQAPPGLYFPGDPGFPGSAAMKSQWSQFAPRTGVVWQPTDKTALRAGWGQFFDTPQLFFNTRFANNPPWGAQITLTSPVGGLSNPWVNYPGGNPFPALLNGWQNQAFPTSGVYVNAPLDTHPTTLQQWNVGIQHQLSSWLLTASYLGNHSSHLWRATELNYAVFSPGATTATTNARRVLALRNPAIGAFYGTIGQLDDTGRANYNGMLLSAQRRMRNGLTVLTNYTLSKCMSDPATTELTGPTITDPTNPALDYSACDSDRRHVVNVSLVAQSPSFSNSAMNAVFGSWQIAPLVRWQSGSPFSVTTGVDNALSGLGGQRAVQVNDDIYGDRSVNNYLNINAFTSPAPGTYSTLRPNAFYGPSRLLNDLALTRSFHLAARQLQFRWEVFNVLNKANFNNPTSALNSTNFGRILSAGDPRIMQFALKYDF